MNRNQALTLLTDEAGRGEIHFPTNTQVTLKIRQALDDPDCHLEAAGKLIQADPLLAAQVVAMANSVAFNPSGREITEVRTAASRLGFQTLRTLVMAQVTRQMAGGASSPEQQRMTAQLWAHSAHVAALARVIARRVSGQNPDTALFAGLVHEIGGFYLLSRSSQYPCLLDARPVSAPGDGTDADVDRIAVENALGLAVLRQLAVPAPLIAAVEHYAQGYLSLPPKSLGDTLLLADYLAPVASPLLPAEGDQGAATLDFADGELSLSQVLAESAEEVDSLIAALR
jgi:HD-like signal output (HDOD) protein